MLINAAYKHFILGLFRLIWVLNILNNRLFSLCIQTNCVWAVLEAGWTRKGKGGVFLFVFIATQAGWKMAPAVPSGAAVNTDQFCF